MPEDRLAALEAQQAKLEDRIDSLESDRPERVRIGRRTFLLFAGSAALIGGASGSAAAQGTTEDIDARAQLIGAGAPPSPDSAFFADKSAYHYEYLDRSSGARWLIETEDDAWSLVPGSRNRLIDALDEDMVVSNDTTETTVFDPTVPAGQLFGQDAFRLPVTGKYTTTNSTEQFTLRFHVGTTAVASVTSVENNVSDQPWYAELYVTIRETGANGTAKPHVVAAFDNAHDDQHSGEVTVDTTVDEGFDVTVEWDEANQGNEVAVGQAWLMREGTVAATSG